MEGLLISSCFLSTFVHHIFVVGRATTRSEDKVFWPQFPRYLITCSQVSPPPLCCPPLLSSMLHIFPPFLSQTNLNTSPPADLLQHFKGFAFKLSRSKLYATQPFSTGMSLILIYIGDDLVGGCWDRSNESGCEWWRRRRPSQAIRGNCFPCVAIF